MRVLDHDNAAVDQVADCNCDSARLMMFRPDSEQVHRDKGQPHDNRNRQDRNQRTAEVQEEDNK